MQIAYWSIIPSLLFICTVSSKRGNQCTQPGGCVRQRVFHHPAAVGRMAPRSKAKQIPHHRKPTHLSRSSTHKNNTNSTTRSMDAKQSSDDATFMMAVEYFAKDVIVALMLKEGLIGIYLNEYRDSISKGLSRLRNLTKAWAAAPPKVSAFLSGLTLTLDDLKLGSEAIKDDLVLLRKLEADPSNTIPRSHHKSKHIEDAQIAKDLRDGLDTGRYLLNDPDGEPSIFIKLSEPAKLCTQGSPNCSRSARIEESDWWSPITAVREHLQYADLWMTFLDELNSKLESSEFQIQKQTSQGQFSNWFESNYITAKNIMEALDLMVKEYNLLSIKDNISEMAATVNDDRLNYLNEILRIFLKVKPKCSMKKNVAYVGAPYLLMSQVVNCSRMLTMINSNISGIAVIASARFYFDDDFTINSIRSPELELGMIINLIIISPEWILKAGDLQTIGLTGRRPAEFKSLSKTEGEPGLPGEMGGRFLGLVGNVTEGELIIVLDGGQGGDGQSGSHESTCIIGCLKDEVIPDTYEYCCKGNKTSWYNRGVNGGQRGKGGLPGEYKIFIFTPGEETQLHFQQNPGSEGEEGFGGNFSAIMDGFRCNDEAINASGILVHDDPFRYCHNIDYPQKHVVKPLDDEQREQLQGHAGKSTIEPIPPMQAAHEPQKYGRVIVRYKNWSRKHFHLFNARRIYKFISNIDSSDEVEIRNFSTTLDLYEEFKDLGKQPAAGGGYLDRELLKLSYQSLAARAREHALLYNGDIEALDDYVKFNLFLSAAARSKMLALSYPFEPKFVTDLKDFLAEEKSRIEEFKAAMKEQAQYEHLHKIVPEYNAHFHKHFKEAVYLTNITINAKIDALEMKLGRLFKDLLLRILLVGQGASKENVGELRKQLLSTRTGNVAWGLLKTIGDLVNLLLPVGAAINEGVDFGDSIFNPSPGNTPVTPVMITETVASWCSASALRFRKSTNYTIKGFKRQVEAVKSYLKVSDAEAFPNALQAIETVGAAQYFGDGSDPTVSLDNFPPADCVLSYKRVITIETAIKDAQRNVSSAIRLDEKNLDLATAAKLAETIQITTSILKGGASAFNQWEQELDNMREIKIAIDGSEERTSVLRDQVDRLETEILAELNNLFGSLSDERQLRYREFSLAVSVVRHRMQSAVQTFEVELRKEFLEGTDLYKHFELCGQSVEDVVDTLSEFYQRIDAYREQVKLANFTAEVALNPEAQYWGTLKDQTLQKKFDELTSTFQGEVLLKRQSLVEGAFRMWNFPVVEPALCDFKNLSGRFAGFPTHEIVRKFAKEIETRLDDLIEIVNAGRSSTGPGAKYIIKNEFNHTGGGSPFYKWPNSSFSEFITSILAGVPTFLHSELFPEQPACEAIKVTRLSLSFGSVDSNAGQEKDLEAVLNQYTVSLTRGGNSYYLFGNQTFVIPGETVDFYFSFEVDGNGLPTIQTKAYEKLVSGDLTLSPYSTWGVQIRPIDADQGFEPLAKYANSFDLYLEGSGLCVRKSFAVEGDYVSPNCEGIK